MTAVVVDTNVGVVANGQADHASKDCVLRCIERLREVIEGHLIVLDDGWRILGEYVRYLSPSGQPGPGDMFMKWVFDNRANPQRCELVPITQKVGSDNNFLEFPDDPDLNGFDPSDRMYVAVALASENSPSILNAVDSGWWIHRAALSRHGIEIDFVCPEMMDANG